MFLQAVYLGVSLGSVIGPFIARPFLSIRAKRVDNHDASPELNLDSVIDGNR